MLSNFLNFKTGVGLIHDMTILINVTSSAILFSDDDNYGSPRWTALGLEVCVGLVESLLMMIM